MLVFTSPSALKNHLNEVRHAPLSLGFVPTMGALHEGHLELVKRSVSENDLTIASVFINPLQFNNPDDLQKYPRTLEADRALLEGGDCDLLFAPSAGEMYMRLPVLKLDFGELEHTMEGAFRPGHFNGVGVVVARLFNMIQPQKAYFGQKDLQQVAVVRRLIEDLAFPIELIPCDTVREADGLAMSSRNRRLRLEDRIRAPFIYQSLLEAKEQLLTGTSVEEVSRSIREQYAQRPEFLLEYFEVVDVATLLAVAAIQPLGRTAICLAAHLGGVRLIDNVIF